MIIGNPPYSVGQKNENDNNKNLQYDQLDSRIKKTYANKSKAKLKIQLYDSYIRAIRWATDRVGDKGIVSFVTNGSFIDANNMDGLRCHLEKDFTSLYIFNLKGNTRKKGEELSKEGGKIFGQGSRATIAISFLVKNPEKTKSTIYYAEIGDYLKREQKLEKIEKLGTFSSIDWKVIKPNKNFDWINQRDEAYEKFIPMGDKKNSEKAIFTLFSTGIKTNRDSWVYNFNQKKLEGNIKNTIQFYNSELSRYKKEKNKPKNISNFINNDSTKISWSGDLKLELKKEKLINYQEKNIRLSVYRPFSKQHLYYSKELNNSRYLTYKIFPEANTKNLAICVSGVGCNNFSELMVNITPDLELVSKNQIFPRYYYEEGVKKDNISQVIVRDFQENYSDKKINGDSIFYYIYGLLHSKDYREKYSSNFGKMLPRIPFVNDFWGFSEIGKKLSDLHINYENQKKYLLKIDGLKSKNFKVGKMRFPSKEDKSKIIYNDSITLNNIPKEAHEYIVNGKSAIEWIIDRYQVKRNKDSDIINDPNNFSQNPKYILELLQKVITVSVESVSLIKQLPAVNEKTILDISKPDLKVIKGGHLEKDKVAVEISQEKQKTSFEKAIDKRLSLASLIIDSDKKLGRVKLEKIFYITDQEIKEDLKTNYTREAAGPLDQRALYNEKIGIEAKANTFNVFETKTKSKKVEYIPKKLFKSYVEKSKLFFSSSDYEKIEKTISLMSKLDTVRCEIIATLYACWNDLIISRKSIKDESIIKSFFSWSSRKKELSLSYKNNKKEKISNKHLLEALSWMRKNNLTPKGKGRKISVKIKFNENEPF